MSNLTIISDGTDEGTKVKVGDEFVKNVIRIDIEPDESGKNLQAVITVIKPALELELKNARIECSNPEVVEQIQESIQNAINELNENL